MSRPPGEIKDAGAEDGGDSRAAARRRRRRHSGGGGGGADGADGGGGDVAAKPLSELQLEWEWLDGISPEDRSWMHFALYNGFQAQARLGGMALVLSKRYRVG